MVEKIYKQMLLLAATKNLKWEILTKNLVTFKRWDRFKDERINFMGVYWKIQFSGEGP